MRSRTSKACSLQDPGPKSKSKPKSAFKRKRKSTKAKTKARRSSYRQTYPDPRPTSREKYTWSEDWHMGYPFPHRRHMPVLDFHSVGNTPNTEARLIRPASLPRMTHPRAPRDFWRDGVVTTSLPSESDNDSGYGSNSGSSDKAKNAKITLYDPKRDQISPPLQNGQVVVEPNRHFHVEWTYPRGKKTTKSGYRYQCRVINGYKDGVVRSWAQGAFTEGGRWYLARHDDYRRKVENSTFNFNNL